MQEELAQNMKKLPSMEPHSVERWSAWLSVLPATLSDASRKLTVSALCEININLYAGNITNELRKSHLALRNFSAAKNESTL